MTWLLIFDCLEILHCIRRKCNQIVDIEWCVTLKVTLVSVELLNRNLYFSILISYAVYDNQSHY